MITTFTLNNLEFSFKKPLIIAEIGTSHNGNINKAKELVSAAKYAGASAVKFQIVYADEILHKKTGFVNLPTGKISLYDRFKELEVQIDVYADIFKYAEEQGLLVSATPFGLKSAEELFQLAPNFFKIASPELNYTQLLKQAALYNLPTILSTGVSLLKDIEAALNEIKAVNPALQTAILHCVTSYPAPEQEYNVSILQALSSIFGCAVGISDHSLDPVLVPVLAAAYGACIIEKHICLSRKQSGLDDPVALEPDMFKTMTDTLKATAGQSKEEVINFLVKEGNDKEFIYQIIGDGKKEQAISEKANYGKTNRSLHYLKDLKAGSIITKDDIAILRTEKTLTAGASPNLYNFFIGAVLQKNVTDGAGIQMEDFIKRAH